MGESYITRRGGSGSGGGTIVVTAPSGSTVTIEKDERHFTRGLNSQGQAVFKALQEGNWNITITRGAERATTTVYVKTNYPVEMTYWNGELYDGSKGNAEANQIVNVTGGWAARGLRKSSNGWIAKAPNVDFQSDKMHIALGGNEYYSGIVEIQKDMDLTNYTQLKIIKNSTSSMQNTYSQWLAVMPRNTEFFDNTTACIKLNMTDAPGTKDEQALDISELNGKYDVFLGLAIQLGQSHKLDVYKIWLE